MLNAKLVLDTLGRGASTPAFLDSQGQACHQGRSGRPSVPCLSSLDASTWCSWILFCSNATRDAAIYKPHIFAVAIPTSATASPQCATRLWLQSRNVMA